MSAHLIEEMYKALRTAIIEGDVSRSLLPASFLEEWSGEPAVFTRRPVPQEAPERICIINPPVSITDADALISRRPVWASDLAFYGRKGMPGDDDDDTRLVERAASHAQLLFHREKNSVRLEGFSVIDVVAGGPIPGPTDDDKTVGRLVPIRIRLRRND